MKEKRNSSGKLIKTKEEVFNELKDLFNIPSDRKWEDVQKAKGQLSFCSDEKQSFFIVKSEFDRDEVIEMLLNYFEDKVLESGYGLAVSPITLLYTEFSIQKVSEQ